MEPDWVVRFYNQRGTAEQHIKEGKYAFHWTRLSCRKFRDMRVSHDVGRRFQRMTGTYFA
jgi:hypothetical protein